jgi:hypothetical protein
MQRPRSCPWKSYSHSYHGESPDEFLATFTLLNITGESLSAGFETPIDVVISQ